METIKLRFDYKSQNKNGWPLMMVTVNDVVLDRFQADQSTWQREYTMDLLDCNSLKIWHFGKNYNLDHNPDKFLQLERIWINGVDLQHHIHLFRQIAFLPPWDHESPPAHSLYLGHEGYLELRFDNPVNDWIQKLFGINQDTMHGQSTTREVLNEIKKYFSSLDA